MDIKEATRSQLINELCLRYDAGVFLGLRSPIPDDKDGLGQRIKGCVRKRTFWGNQETCIGMLHKASAQITMTSLSEEEDLVNTEDQDVDDDC